jgi:hypothetical protein
VILLLQLITSGQPDLSTPWIVADQIVSIPMKQNNADQLRKADFVITPELNTILSTDFSFVDSLIFLGYNTTKPLLNSLKSKIDSAIYNSFPEEEKYFYKIQLSDSLTLKEKAFFYGYETLDSISNKKLNYDLYKLFETGDYKKLSAQILVTEEGSILNLIKEENPILIILI